MPIVFGKQLEELAAGILVPLPASPRSELRRDVCLFSLNRNLDSIVRSDLRVASMDRSFSFS